MSFINKLAKGFVKSAVNQVGRDSGKVVSNQIYGDAHSTPIRGVHKSNSRKTTIDPKSLIEKKEYIGVKFFWAILISALVPIIGGLIIVYRGFANFNKKFITMYKIEKHSVYASDRRYKTGRRYEGTKQVKVPVQIQINESQKSRKRDKSYGYFIIGVLSIVFYIVLFNTN